MQCLVEVLIVITVEHGLGFVEDERVLLVLGIGITQADGVTDKLVGALALFHDAREDIIQY